MSPAPILTRAEVSSAILRWAVAVTSAISAALAFAAYASSQPLAFLGVFVADILIAAVATLATELALKNEPDLTPMPEELALYACLHCGVLALLMMSTPGGLPCLALLAVHQALLVLNVRRLPAA